MDLAVCGSDLKIINVSETCSVVCKYDASYLQPGSRFKSTNWSKDDQWLLCSTVQGQFPILRYENRKLALGKLVNIKTATAASFFNKTNKYTAVGCENGEVLVWDLSFDKLYFKINALIKNPIKYLEVNKKDSHVAVVETGSADIRLCSLQSNQLVKTLTLPSSETCSNVSFSQTGRAILGAASESVIMVWDILKTKTIFKKHSAHLGTISDFSFSPINDMLLSSVSFDKTLKIFDFRDDKELGKMTAPKSLTCVDVLFDGKHVAAGSSSGNVYIYDLRNVSTYLFDIQCDNKPISHIQGQCYIKPSQYESVKYKFDTDSEMKINKSVELSIIDLLSPAKETNVSVISARTDPKEYNELTVTEELNSPDSFLAQLSILQTKSDSLNFKTEPISPLLIQRTSDNCIPDLRRSVMEKSLHNTKYISQDTQVTSTPCATIKTKYEEPNISPILSSSEHIGDGVHVLQKQVVDNLTRLIHQQSEKLSKEMDEIYTSLLEALLSVIKRDIFNNFCCTKMEHLGLKYQIENLQKDIDLIKEQNIQIIEVLQNLQNY